MSISNRQQLDTLLWSGEYLINLQRILGEGNDDADKLMDLTDLRKLQLFQQSVSAQLQHGIARIGRLIELRVHEDIANIRGRGNNDMESTCSTNTSNSLQTQEYGKGPDTSNAHARPKKQRIASYQVPR